MKEQKKKTWLDDLMSDDNDDELRDYINESE